MAKVVLNGKEYALPPGVTAEQFVEQANGDNNLRGSLGLKPIFYSATSNVKSGEGAASAHREKQEGPAPLDMSAVEAGRQLGIMDAIGDPLFWESVRENVRGGARAIGGFVREHPLESAAIGTAAIPGVGNVVGAVADTRALIEDPSLLNAAFLASNAILPRGIREGAKRSIFGTPEELLKKLRERATEQPVVKELSTEANLLVRAYINDTLQQATKFPSEVGNEALLILGHQIRGQTMNGLSNPETWKILDGTVDLRHLDIVPRLEASYNPRFAKTLASTQGLELGEFGDPTVTTAAQIINDYQWSRVLDPEKVFAGEALRSFTRFFKDSVVTMADGKPLPVFVSTTQRAEPVAGRLGRFRTPREVGQHSGPFDSAEAMRELRTPVNALFAGYVNAKNPLAVPDLNMNSANTIIEWARTVNLDDIGPGLAKSARLIRGIAANKPSGDELRDIAIAEKAHPISSEYLETAGEQLWFRGELKKHGYDSILYTNVKESTGGWSMTLFDEGQYKSVANIGTFNPQIPTHSKFDGRGVPTLGMQVSPMSELSAIEAGAVRAQREEQVAEKQDTQPPPAILLRELRKMLPRVQQRIKTLEGLQQRSKEQEDELRELRETEQLWLEGIENLKQDTKEVGS